MREISILLKTRNNQRLWSAGATKENENAFTPMLCCKFHMIDGPNTHDQMPSDIEHPHLSDQIALCEFHSFQVEVQMNAGYIHVTHT